jgi:hypothetical protein
MKVELRWVSRKTGHQYLDGTVVKDVREQVLQYRQEYDPGGSYPQLWWSDWQDVPTVMEEDL